MDYASRSPKRGRPSLCTLRNGLLLSLALTTCSSESEQQILHLEVVGHQYNWYIRYPGDDVVVTQHIHVPAHTDLEMTITSKDLLYVFRLPELKQTQMAVPEILFPLAFNSGEPNKYLLKGDQMCGFSHPTLIGDFIVEPLPHFKKWLAQQR